MLALNDALNDQTRFDQPELRSTTAHQAITDIAPVGRQRPQSAEASGGWRDEMPYRSTRRGRLLSWPRIPDQTKRGFVDKSARSPSNQWSLLQPDADAAAHRDGERVDRVELVAAYAWGGPGRVRS